MNRLDGFGITGYRSFGADTQRIGPLDKINLFIGKNNSGKSNILRFSNTYFSKLSNARSPGISIEPLDQHKGSRSAEFGIEIGYDFESQLFKSWLNRIVSNAEGGKRALADTLLKQVLRSAIFTHATNLAWIPRLSKEVPSSILSAVRSQSGMTESQWLQLWNALTNTSGGSIDIWVKETLKILLGMHHNVPPVVIVNAIREVRQGDKDKSNLDGSGLIQKLAQLQNPGIGERHLQKRFDAVNDFLRDVTGSDDAEIEIPNTQDDVYVHMDNRVLPLSHLGTGIHEVIILAAAATVTDDSILCIEEPEIHLHPTLQRRLLNYLNEKTENQYLIASHSAHLMDSSFGRIFSVELLDGATVVSPVETRSHRFEAVSDLGYKASDLLQSNCIVWVEGPSDRIYLNHWIQEVDSALVEGLHYSIMFYGGRLLAHLSASDEEVDAFISLKSLNRNTIILIDSDKSCDTDSLNATKQRVISEFQGNRGFAWVTAGREIENYIEPNLFREAVKNAIDEDTSMRASAGQYTDQMVVVGETGQSRKLDKMKVARAVADQPVVLDHLDLMQNVTNLIGYIGKCN